MSWRGWVMLLLLAGAIASGWSLWKQRKAEAPDTLAARSDYVLHQFEIVSLDPDGSEAFTLRAPRLVRDPADKSLDLQTPLFLVPEGEGAYWEVRGQTGSVDPDGERIHLQGEVVATSPPGSAPVKIAAPQLDVFPRTRRASSPDEVVVTRPGLTMRGRGLEADLQRKLATFKSNVRTRYVPNSR